MIAVLVMLVLAVIALKTSFLQRVLPFIFCFLCIISLAKHIMSRKGPSRRQVIRAIVGFSRRFRKIFAVGWDVEILHLIVLILFFVLLIIHVYYRSSFFAMDIGAWGLATLFILAGTIDALRVTIAMAKFTWARWTGKAFYVAVVAFSVWAGDVYSRKLVAQATGLNPIHFIATERLIQWLITPLIGLGVIAVVISTVSLFVYAIVVASSMSKGFVQTLASGMPRLTPPREKASIAYRLTYGKNPMRGVPRRFFQWDSALRMMRPLAICMTGLAILYPLGQLQNLPMVRLEPIIRDMVVQIEFNTGQKCGNRVMGEPVAHLEKGRIAVAAKLQNDWKLEQDICEVEKEVPKRP